MGGPKVATVRSGEGNSGGIGEGMQYQHNEIDTFEKRDDQLIQPLDGPIEGVLISDEEARLAPVL